MNPEELKFYTVNCSSVDALTFPAAKAGVFKMITDKKTSVEGKLLFAEWLFHKLKIVWMAPQAVREELFPSISTAIERCKTVTVKMRYLNWNDIEYCQRFLAHFYTHRFEEALFIEQMLNDSSLLKWSQNLLAPEELLAHFIKWIRSVETYEQRSNLLDVLLRYFPTNAEVRSIYKDLMGGKTLYENAQNVHDDDVSVAVLKAVKELHTWYHTQCGHKIRRITCEACNEGVDTTALYKAVDLTRADWLEARLLAAAGAKGHAVVKGILQRIAIDKTMFEFTDDNSQKIRLDAFEVLFLLLNFILTEENRAIMLECLMEELQAAMELCISGYIARAMNAVQGLSERFQMTLPFQKQLQAKVNYDLSKALLALPESSNVVLGTYDAEFKGEYYEFIKKVVKVNELYAQYGVTDVRKYLPAVLNGIVGETVWTVNEKGLRFS